MRWTHISSEVAKLGTCNLHAFKVLTSTAISVFLVSSAIFSTLYQMLRQKKMSSLCTNWNHLQGTNKVGKLHMLHTEPSELYLLVFQYCQLSKPLQKEKKKLLQSQYKKKKSLKICAFVQLLPLNFQFVNENKTLIMQVF